MVYIIAKGKVEGRVLLVSAESKDELLSRIKLKEGESIIGSLMSSEVSVLDKPYFAVVSA